MDTSPPTLPLLLPPLSQLTGHECWKEREKRRRKAAHAKPTGLAMHLLPPERAALGQARLATGGLAEHGGASLADDDGLGVGEDGGDGEAAGALDVHEERAGSRHKSLTMSMSVSDDVHSVVL
jgi:hypothetical protein